MVEHHLAKVEVAGSNPVFRSTIDSARLRLCSAAAKWSFLFQVQECSGGGIGRHVGLKIQWPLWPCGFKSRSEYDEESSYEVRAFFMEQCEIKAGLVFTAEVLRCPLRVPINEKPRVTLGFFME